MKAEHAQAIADSQKKLATIRPGTRVQTGYSSKIEWVPVAKIQVMPEAQRPFDPKLADAIAKNFDPDLLGYPLVAFEEATGIYWIPDGQHRVEAVKKALGEDQLMQCEVVRGVDRARMAQLFTGRNTRRNVTIFDRYLVGITAENPECVAIDSILKELDLRVARGDGDGIISAAGTLQRLYRNDPGPQPGAILRQVLELVLESWGREQSSFNGDVLAGLGLFLVRYGQSIEAGVLEKRLAGYAGGPMGLLGKSRGRRDALGGSLAVNVARTVVDVYNTGRKHRLPKYGEK